MEFTRRPATRSPTTVSTSRTRSSATARSTWCSCTPSSRTSSCSGSSPVRRFVRELSSWARVIVFDKRGVGLWTALRRADPRGSDRRPPGRARCGRFRAHPRLRYSDGGALVACSRRPTRNGPSASPLERRCPDGPRPGLPVGDARGALRGAAARAYGAVGRRVSGRGDRANDVHVHRRAAGRGSGVRAMADSAPAVRASPGDHARFSRMWFSTDARSVLPRSKCLPPC